MDSPETITKVFTKYDTIPRQIDVPIPINDFESSNCSVHTCWVTDSYCLLGIEQGLEGVVFVQYMKNIEGGFITTTVSIIDNSCSGIAMQGRNGNG